MDVTTFKEIEHKFVVDAGFDLEAFDRALTVLQPIRRGRIEVLDRYFVTEDGLSRGYVLRHRYDRELHQLTIKSRESDPQVRDEITLDLGHHAGDQREAVDAFMARMGVRWTGSLTKDLRVWYFTDCEVVHYVARAEGREVHCVEFEAIAPTSVPDALSVLARYEAATGLDGATRERASILDLLFPGVFDRGE